MDEAGGDGDADASQRLAFVNRWSYGRVGPEEEGRGEGVRSRER